jgi:hypothetical protein
MSKLISVAICLLASGVAVAQERSPAESALAKYMEASQAYDTVRMANAMHPEALQRFRGVIVAALEGGKGDMARAELLPLFSVGTPEELARLSDVEAFQRMTDAAGRSAPQLLELMAQSKFEIVGSVVTDGIAYVTYVLTIPVEGRTLSQEVVQKLKQNGGQWMLLLPTTAEATIVGIESRYH